MIVDETLWDTSATTAPGTVRWKAPELMDPMNPQTMVSTQADVYAFAMTSLVSLDDRIIHNLLTSYQELLTGKPPFYPEFRNDGMVLLAVVNRCKIPSRPAKDTVHDLLWEQWVRCWSRDPNLRPLMSQLSR
jgi:serine/threonine protein kinase